MKKILLIIAIFIGSFGLTYAEEEATDVNVTIGTEIPGINCTPNKKDGKISYKCKVPKSTKAIVSMLGDIIKYFTFMTLIAGVLFIVINGVLYSMGGLDQELKTKGKEKILKTLIGIIVLFSAGYILRLIAPWIF